MFYLYLYRFPGIEEVNLKGPVLRAVLEINTSALAQAAETDEERKKRTSRYSGVAESKVFGHTFVVMYLHVVYCRIILLRSLPMVRSSRKRLIFISDVERTIKNEYDGRLVQSSRQCCS